MATIFSYNLHIVGVSEIGCRACSLVGGFPALDIGIATNVFLSCGMSLVSHTSLITSRRALIAAPYRFFNTSYGNPSVPGVVLPFTSSSTACSSVLVKGCSILVLSLLIFCGGGASVRLRFGKNITAASSANSSGESFKAIRIPSTWPFMCAPFFQGSKCAPKFSVINART